MSKVDLHVHTTASDGRFTPEEIVRKAAELGLTVLGITDHDAVHGVAPAIGAAEAFPRLTVVPGVEINTDVPDGEAHILGYFLDCTNSSLTETLDKLRNSRIYRGRKMVARLKELGVPVDWHRVQELAGSGSLGRPHIAQALLEKGHIKSFREAFDRYIGRNGPAYVEREKITPEGAVELILKAEGLPVLAHPFTIPDPEAMVAALKKVGLVGLETYYAGYDAVETRRLQALGETYGLIATGGTDYHGLDNTGETTMGQTDVPQTAVDELFALARERRLLRES